MNNQPAQRCETCRFSQPLEDSLLLCKRRAPIPMGLMGETDDPESQQAGGWPTVFSDDWCGDYDPAPPSTDGVSYREFLFNLPLSVVNAIERKASDWETLLSVEKSEYGWHLIDPSEWRGIGPRGYELLCMELALSGIEIPEHWPVLKNGQFRKSRQ